MYFGFVLCICLHSCWNDSKQYDLIWEWYMYFLKISRVELSSNNLTDHTFNSHFEFSEFFSIKIARVRMLKFNQKCQRHVVWLYGCILDTLEPWIERRLICACIEWMNRDEAPVNSRPRNERNLVQFFGITNHIGDWIWSRHSHPDSAFD